MSTRKKIVGGLVALLVVGSVAAAAGSSSSTASPDKPAATTAAKAATAAKPKAKRKAPPKGSITFSQYRRVHTGMTKSQVRALLGAPNDRDYTEAKILDDNTKMETWTYTNRGQEFGVFVFSFTNGILDTKGSA